MKKSLRLSSLLLGSVLLTTLAQSQTDRFAYAVTDVQQDGANWSFLRKLNLRNGLFSDVLLNGTDAKQVAFDAITKKEITAFSTEKNRGYNLQPAFSSGVAAMAYDRKNNRLWYTPMFIDQLRYIDLKTMKAYYVTSQEFTGMTKKSPDQGNIITRMVIADDGNGYAMTNDGAHLIKFSTGKKLNIVDLGMLADNPESKGVSIHSSCSSFGGDMIADNEGNLYVFSARNHVFKVNIETKVATHLGVISGVPANFTTNGAVVTEDNHILISSAIDARNYYLVDAKTLAATSYPLTAGWRSSDMANSNILNTAKPKKTTAEIASRIIPDASLVENKVQLYPNPVTNNRFAIQFTKLEAGDYTIQVTDVMGRQVVQRVVSVMGEDQVESVQLNAAAIKGFYLVKIINKDSKTVFSNKLVVQ
ncbi:MAG TPA: T9SS type A sorting domain-containing protein [Chitinophagaceae bacterium]